MGYISFLSMLILIYWVNTKALLDASKEVGLEINAEKKKFVRVHVSSPEYSTKSVHEGS
jgi:hypothetical protein